jgi:uncharacterized protein YjbJ (UPF0337 family)
MPGDQKKRAEIGTSIALVCPAAKRGRYMTGLIRSEVYMGKDLESRGLENEVKGAAKEMKGKVRGDLGDATDNTSEHIKGRAEELQGKIRKNVGKAERKSDESV